MADETPDSNVTLPGALMLEARAMREMVPFKPVDEARYGEIQLPIIRILECVAEAMHEEGAHMRSRKAEIPEDMAAEGADYLQRADETMRTADQLALIASAYDRIYNGQMPLPGEV